VIFTRSIRYSAAESWRGGGKIGKEGRDGRRNRKSRQGKKSTVLHYQSRVLNFQKRKVHQLRGSEEGRNQGTRNVLRGALGKKRTKKETGWASTTPTFSKNV